MSELWLKNEKVLTLRDKEGVPSDIVKIDNPELLPLSLSKSCTWEDFNKWLNTRIIPADREGFANIKEEFKDDWYKEWLEKTHYNNLTDQYWLKKRDEKWSKINFFTNNYSPDIGDMFFKPWVVAKKHRYNTNTPDLSTGGLLTKRWIQDVNTKESYLVKAASKKTKQEPLSEVLVSVFVEKLGVIESAGYDLHIEGTTMCSICKNFVNENIELVPASDIYFLTKRKEGELVMDHLLKACETFDIPNAEDFLHWLVFIDMITGNRDRNLSNIGFLRDSNTMKFIGPAPLFDCGNAYNDTKAMKNNLRGELFADSEQLIFDKCKNKCNVEEAFKKVGYQKLINDYPNISDVKKENLIEIINFKNKDIINERKLEEVR